MTALFIAASLFAGLAQAQNVEKAIKARKGLMQVYAFNLGIVGAMAKGKTEYNAEMAQNAADNMLAIAKMKNGPMWPQGSGNDHIEFGEMTRALPEIWSTYPAIADKGKDMAAALTAFSAAAGNGLDSLRGAMGDVGDGCKGCHKDFRAKKE